MSPPGDVVLFTDSRDPEEIQRWGGVLFRRCLESHLPDYMRLPAVFPGDSLLDSVTDYGDVAERVTGEREPNPSYLAAVEQLDGRMPVCPVFLPEASADDAVKAAANAAARVNRRITARRMAATYFALESDRASSAPLEMEAVLAYLCESEIPRERRVFEAAALILLRMRRHGDATYPAAVVKLAVNMDTLRPDYRPPGGRPAGTSDVHIRNAFMGAARNAIDGRMHVVSATGKATDTQSGNDGATLMADAFGLSAETVAKAGIKRRYDREFMP